MSGDETENRQWTSLLIKYLEEFLGVLVSNLHPTDWLILALILVSVATVGEWLVGWMGTVLVVGAGATVAAATVTAETESPLVHGVSGFLVVLVGAFVSGIVFVTVTLAQTSSTIGILGGLSMYCLTLGIVGSVFIPFETDETRFTLPLRTTLLVASGVVLVFTAVSATRAGTGTTSLSVLSRVLGFVYSLALSPGAEYAVFTLFSLISVAAVAASVALADAPLGGLLPPDRADYWEPRFAVAAEYLFTVFVVSGVIGVLTSIVTFLPLGEGLTNANVISEYPAGSVFAFLLTNSSIRGLLVFVSLMGVVSVFLFRIRQILRRNLVLSFVYSALPACIGILLGTLGGVAVSEIGIRSRLLSLTPSIMLAGVNEVLRELPAFELANLTFLLVLGLLVPLFLLLELTRIVFTTSGSSGPALASIGLFGLGISAILADIFVGGLVAGAVGLYVWDVGEFSRNARESLPKGAPVYRTESVHAAGSGIVILLSTVTAYILYMVVPPLVVPNGPEIATLGLLLLILLVFPLIYVLRNRG